MKKLVVLIVAVFLVMFLFFSLFMKSKHQADQILKVSNEISEIIFINQDIEKFLYKNISLNNYDNINKHISKIDQKFKFILNEKYFPQFNSSIFKKDFLVLYNSFKEERKVLEKLKSNVAALANSYSFMHNVTHNELDLLKYTLLKDIFTLSYDPEKVNSKTMDKFIKKIDQKTNFDKLFINHANLIINKSIEFNSLKKAIIHLNLNKKLEDFSNNYLSSVDHLREQNKNILYIFMFALIVSIAFLFYVYFRSLKNEIEISRFKSAVENSDNIVVVTDYDQKITYVNEAFTKSTGYTLDDIKGKTPSVLKSGTLDESFYKELNDTIYSGKKWFGEFVNIDKDGKQRYEKASITPIFDTKGNIVSFLSLKLDITDEILAKRDLDESNKKLEKQAKMAALGEMLENIAHQWRQPLSIISTVASGMQVKKQYDTLEDSEFEKGVEEILKSTEYLSNTIDDFRNFYKNDKLMHIFNIKTTIEKSQNIISSKLKKKFIQTDSKLIDCEINGLEGEIIQVLLNLYSNSSDAFKNANNKHNIIVTTMKKSNEQLLIEVKDSAGGVPTDIIDKVFEPYFTTKQKSQGTGIGLYMTYKIITETFKGTITLENVSFQRGENLYTGACFKITLPLS